MIAERLEENAFFAWVEIGGNDKFQVEISQT
jgi:hypothetical protein